MHSVLRMPTDGKMKRMRKGKIIVLILMVFCILIFAIVVAWFLLSKDNYAVPENAATENAVLQVAGLTGNEPRDPQALKSLYAKRVIVRQVNLDSGQFVAPGEDTAGQKGCGEPAVAQNPTPIRCAARGQWFILFAIMIMKFSRLYCPFTVKGQNR